MPERYLDRREAAQYLTDLGLKTSWRTLQKLACIGGGPEYQTWGNRTIYRPSNLDAYAAGKISAPRRHTSEAA